MFPDESNLVDTMTKYAPEMLFVVGDDQGELSPHEAVSAIARSLTDGIHDTPPEFATLDPIRPKAVWAFHVESREFYQFATTQCEHLASSLNSAGFDLSVLRAQPEDRTLGHAGTFFAAGLRPPFRWCRCSSIRTTARTGRRQPAPSHSAMRSQRLYARS